MTNDDEITVGEPDTGRPSGRPSGKEKWRSKKRMEWPKNYFDESLLRHGSSLSDMGDVIDRGHRKDPHRSGE